MDIINDGIRLNAALEMPVAFKEGDKCPLVVIIHGVTGPMNEDHILAVSHMMNEIGFATLRADMYGHGESEGEYRDHTLYKWITNALAMIDYGRSLDFVTDVFLCGHSQGGLTAMLVAAIKHDQIKGLIPLSPATMIPEACRQGDILQFRFDPKHVPDEVTSGEGRVLDGNYFRVAQQIHVEEAIAAFTIEGAYAAYEEQRRGSISAGKYADFVVLDRNLMEIDPWTIRDTKVLMTVIDGKIVYKA